jgi:CobQ-like glutamine amidotransferase family enzyme
MNLYGDHGNVAVLRKRAEWRGIEVEVVEHEIGDKMPADVDIIFFGGGQDSGQGKIATDLLMNGDLLRKMIEDGVSALLVCGAYQLFGKFFKTKDGQVIEGLGVFDIETYGGEKRMIGNVVTESEEFGRIVGYENHSGRTILGAGVEPLGQIVQGDGNNGDDRTEGAVYKNAIGTYLHGPLLPKNSRIADRLILSALRRRGVTEGGMFDGEGLVSLDDELEAQAQEIASGRPR